MKHNIAVFDINSGLRLGSVEFKTENINGGSKIQINSKEYTVVNMTPIGLYVDEYVVG